MPDHAARRAAFRALHEAGCFVIPNPWDAGSARYLRHLGFRALATTSAGFAFSRALPDGAVTRDAMLANIVEIASAVDLPVNADFEAGYAAEPEGVAQNVRLCVAAGVSGLSIEDRISGAQALYDLPAAVERLRAAREAIDASKTGVLLTARAECFLVGHADPLRESVRRLEAYAAAGADVLYAPGIASTAEIQAVVEAVRPKPVNVLISRNTGQTVRSLAELGVRRISVGSSLARAAWSAFMQSAESIARDGDFASFDALRPFAEIDGFFRKDLEERSSSCAAEATIGGHMPRQTLPGSPEPADPFEPHMPGVDLPEDIGEVFTKARAEVASPSAAQGLEPGQQCLGIVTPGRMVMIVAAPKPGAVPAQFVAQVRALLPDERRLNISAVGYTRLEPLLKDKARCIPFLGKLLGFAYLGHSVVVFEGHASAFEAGVRGADVLIVDSAMLPFLDQDWARTAFAAMHPDARIFIEERKSMRMMPVIASRNEKGWRYGEPDGEASYANCLLTTLAKASSAARVRIAAGETVPDLAPIAGSEAEKEWVAELPFRYARLDAAKVIAILQKFAKLSEAGTGVSRAVLKTQLALPGGQRQAVAFELTLTQTGGAPAMEIAKIG